MGDATEAPKKSQKKVTIDENIESTEPTTSKACSKNRCMFNEPPVDQYEARKLLSAGDERIKKAFVIEDSSSSAATTSSKSTATPGSSPKKIPKRPIQDPGPKKSTGKKIFDFFCESRMKPKSIHLPDISLQRGPIIAIFFTLLISSIILWYVFSGDGNEHEDDTRLTKKGNRYKNPDRTTRIVRNSSQIDPNSQQPQIQDPSELTFVLTTTLLIVLAIIAFVFIGAMVHYYQKPNPFAPSSSYSRRRNHRSLSIVSSIFTYHSHHNFLYYLEKNEENGAKRGDETVRLEREISKSRPKKWGSSRSATSGKSIPRIDSSLKNNPATPTSNSLPTTPPIIIVNESN